MMKQTLLRLGCRIGLRPKPHRRGNRKGWEVRIYTKPEKLGLTLTIIKAGGVKPGKWWSDRASRVVVPLYGQAAFSLFEPKRLHRI